MIPSAIIVLADHYTAFLAGDYTVMREEGPRDR